MSCFDFKKRPIKAKKKTLLQWILQNIYKFIEMKCVVILVKVDEMYMI